MGEKQLVFDSVLFVFYRLKGEEIVAVVHWSLLLVF